MEDSSGSFTDSNCNNECRAPTEPPNITTSSLADGEVGKAYSESVDVTGGEGPYTFSITGGSLCSGLTLSGYGTISGTPTTAGTCTFTIRVVDSNGQETTRDLTINIAQAPPPFVITTTSLPAGTVNQGYSTNLQAANGATPYGWSIISGALPSGLQLDASAGEISGYPAIAGTFTFTVQVRDSDGQTATKQYSISIIAQATYCPVGGTGATGTNFPPCIFQGTNYSTFNLCTGQGRPGGCGERTRDRCSQYLPSITRYAHGAASANMLKTFMVIESDCNINAATASSFGLMQLSVGTANGFANRCGIEPGSITSAWLTNPANADKSICIASYFIDSLAQGSCGPQARHIYAGYNAGPLYCRESNDCGDGSDDLIAEGNPPELNCDSQYVRKWECPYADKQHTICECGLYETKQGATYATYCFNNIGF